MGKNCVETYEGWPAKLVGGGVANWKVGQPTDDTGKDRFTLINCRYGFMYSSSSACKKWKIGTK